MRRATPTESSEVVSATPLVLQRGDRLTVRHNGPVLFNPPPHIRCSDSLGRSPLEVHVAPGTRVLDIRGSRGNILAAPGDNAHIHISTGPGVEPPLIIRGTVEPQFIRAQGSHGTIVSANLRNPHGRHPHSGDATIGRLVDARDSQGFIHQAPLQSGTLTQNWKDSGWSQSFNPAP